MQHRRIPATIITGFLGAGKTTLLRHVLQNAGRKKIAVIVNEFGELGIDGEILKSCGIEGCNEDNIVELANGCLCCTVADEFLPTMEALINRADPPDHIIIETSGLALPKPLIKAFNWPDIKSKITVDGVITVVDTPAAVAGRFADDPEKIAQQREEDPSLDHDNPLAEVFEDQLCSADLIILNKVDLVAQDEIEPLIHNIRQQIPRNVKIIQASEGNLDPAILLGLDAKAEDDLHARPSHHDTLDGDHEHDDFSSFTVSIPPASSPESLINHLIQLAAKHDILRIKGYVEIIGKPMRLEIQGVGQRFRHHFDRLWKKDELRQSRLVIIGEKGIDEAAIKKALNT